MWKSCVVSKTEPALLADRLFDDVRTLTSAHLAPLLALACVHNLSISYMSLENYLTLMHVQTVYLTHE